MVAKYHTHYFANVSLSIHLLQTVQSKSLRSFTKNSISQKHKKHHNKSKSAREVIDKRWESYKKKTKNQLTFLVLLNLENEIIKEKREQVVAKQANIL